MGYTHYWKIPSETQAVWEKHWPLLVMDARVIVQAAGVRLRKSIDDDAIDLNGYDESHEDFVLKPICIDFDCCKTAGKDYDISVSAILLRASQLSGQAIQVSSDGDWDYEWMEARELVSKLWPIDDMKCPWDEEGGGESEEEMEENVPDERLEVRFQGQ
uniref:Uncharacterized protein n=1 Tax=Ramularia collo-cygni TaxID=112498 RepID=A0A2D3V5K1_9PEZI